MVEEKMEENVNGKEEVDGDCLLCSMCCVVHYIVLDLLICLTILL